MQVLVDVGAGTGISARQFALFKLKVIGIEPNDDMREQAIKNIVPSMTNCPTYLKGSAENTGLPNATANSVVAAQAFHWFNKQQALQEFHRILKPNGWVILLWNERDESDKFTAAYGDLIRSLPDTNGIESSRIQAGHALLQSLLFENTDSKRFTNTQSLDESGLIGRAFSISYAPRDEAAMTKYKEALRKLFKHFQKDGRVTLCYETTVYLGQRRSECRETMK